MKSDRKLVTEEEYELLKGSGGRRTALGYLVGVREEGLSLDQVHRDAIGQPHQEEHLERKKQVYAFLNARRQEFGIPPEEDNI